MARWLRTPLAAAALAAMPATGLMPAAAAPRPRPVSIDAARVLAAEFGNDAPWYRDRIPLFEASDAELTAVYYYRWRIFRAHQRDLGAAGYITTEFLDDVPWQREPYASLNDASGFHIAEGRWLRDRRFTADYIDFMYRGGNDRHFTDHMADSVWSRYLVDGDRAEALRHLSAMRLLYGQWDERFDGDKGLYWIEPLLDATEYTVSSIDASGGKDGFRGGDAFRPSINAYMFANARAIARLSALAGDAGAAADYAARAEAIRARVQESLWSDALGHFIDRYKVGNAHVAYWQPIRARELVGFVPWMFDLPADTPRLAAAWRHLISPQGFAGRAGLRTVEPGYEHYMRQYRYEGRHPECQWNGPVWPFQTTQVLNGMANLLDHYRQDVVTRADFLRLLRQYAALHRQGDGRLDLEEDYHPETGRPIVGLARSHHYFHSGFNDLVLTGLVGIRPRADDALEVNPLLPPAGDAQAIGWFRAERIAYHGHDVAITWDADGRRYGRGAGLIVEVDGRVAARRAAPGRIIIPLPRRAAAPIARPINHAMQLWRSGFPRLSASGNTDPEALHDAVDGRTWFFPEAPNGWTSAADGEQWFALELSEARPLARAELAFLDDGRAIAAPSVTIQAATDKGWRDLAGGPALANGITELRWPRASIARLRIVMRAPPGRRIRLIEAKLFDETR